MKQHSVHPVLVSMVALVFAVSNHVAAESSPPQLGATPTYVWSQSESSGPIALGSAMEWFCGIKSISGRFDGDRESVTVGKDSTGNWYLHGNSNRKFVEVEALCFPFNSVAAGLNFQNWKQGSDPVKLGSANDRFCALTSVSGNFKGRQEAVKVEVQGGEWVLDGQSNKSGIAATAACVSTLAPVKSYAWNQDVTSQHLLPAGHSVCLLNSMSGEFIGGQTIALGWDAGTWTLGGTSNRTNTHIATTAACLLLDLPCPKCPNPGPNPDTNPITSNR